MKFKNIKTILKNFLCRINIHFPGVWREIEHIEDWYTKEESICTNCNKRIERDLSKHIY